MISPRSDEASARSKLRSIPSDTLPLSTSAKSEKSASNTPSESTALKADLVNDRPRRPSIKIKHTENVETKKKSRISITSTPSAWNKPMTPSSDVPEGVTASHAPKELSVMPIRIDSFENDIDSTTITPSFCRLYGLEDETTLVRWLLALKEAQATLPSSKFIERLRVSFPLILEPLTSKLNKLVEEADGSASRALLRHDADDDVWMARAVDACIELNKFDDRWTETYSDFESFKLIFPIYRILFTHFDIDSTYFREAELKFHRSITILLSNALSLMHTAIRRVMQSVDAASLSTCLHKITMMLSNVMKVANEHICAFQPSLSSDEITDASLCCRFHDGSSISSIPCRCCTCHKPADLPTSSVPTLYDIILLVSQNRALHYAIRLKDLFNNRDSRRQKFSDRILKFMNEVKVITVKELEATAEFSRSIGLAFRNNNIANPWLSFSGRSLSFLRSNCAEDIHSCYSKCFGSYLGQQVKQKLPNLILSAAAERLEASQVIATYLTSDPAVKGSLYRASLGEFISSFDFLVSRGVEYDGMMQYAAMRKVLKKHGFSQQFIPPPLELLKTTASITEEEVAAETKGEVLTSVAAVEDGSFGQLSHLVSTLGAELHALLNTGRRTMNFNSSMALSLMQMTMRDGVGRAQRLISTIGVTDFDDLTELFRVFNEILQLSQLHLGLVEASLQPISSQAKLSITTRDKLIHLSFDDNLISTRSNIKLVHVAASPEKVGVFSQIKKFFAARSFRGAKVGIVDASNSEESTTTDSLTTAACRLTNTRKLIEKQILSKSVVHSDYAACLLQYERILRLTVKKIEIEIGKFVANVCQDCVNPKESYVRQLPSSGAEQKLFKDLIDSLLQPTHEALKLLSAETHFVLATITTRSMMSRLLTWFAEKNVLINRQGGLALGFEICQLRTASQFIFSRMPDVPVGIKLQSKTTTSEAAAWNAVLQLMTAPAKARKDLESITSCTVASDIVNDWKERRSFKYYADSNTIDCNSAYTNLNIQLLV